MSIDIAILQFVTCGFSCDLSFDYTSDKMFSERDIRRFKEHKSTGYGILKTIRVKLTISLLMYSYWYTIHFLYGHFPNSLTFLNLELFLKLLSKVSFIVPNLTFLVKWCFPKNGWKLPLCFDLRLLPSTISSNNPICHLCQLIL